MNALNIHFTIHLGNRKFAPRTYFVSLSPYMAVSRIFSTPVLSMTLLDLE